MWRVGLQEKNQPTPLPKGSKLQRKTSLNKLKNALDEYKHPETSFEVNAGPSLGGTLRRGTFLLSKKPIEKREIKKKSENETNIKTTMNTYRDHKEKNKTKEVGFTTIRNLKDDRNSRKSDSQPRTSSNFSTVKEIQDRVKQVNLHFQ